MPVADPAIADVLTVIKSRLSVLLTEDDDEYSTVVSEVVLPSREQEDLEADAIPQTPKDNQIVVSIGDLTRVPELDCPGNPPREAWQVEYRIRLRLMPSELDPEPIDYKLLRFARDIRKAVVTSSGTYNATWYMMDGNAIDARWGETFERLINDGTSQSDGYIMPLLVTMRLNENAL